VPVFKNYFKSIKFDVLLNVVLLITCLLLNLRLDRFSSDWDRLGDYNDYLFQSSFSIFNPEMYFRHATAYTPRPFTTPFFYHLAGGNWNTIVNMQLCIHTISLFFLGYAVSLFIGKKWIKYLFIISIYILGSWWNILGWTILLLSESLSVSFLFLWIASFLVLLKKRSTLSLTAHLIITLFFSFTRDNWCYILPIYYGLVLIVSVISREKFVRKALLCFCFSILVFFIQQASIRVGERSKLSLNNSMVIRVFPNDGYYKWFVSHGMPDIDTVRKKLSKIDIKNQKHVDMLYTFSGSDSTHPEYFKWLKEHGQNTYAEFLITHPSYTFLQEETREQLQRIFAYNIWYIHSPRSYSKYTSTIFPLFNVWELLFLTLAVFIFYLRKKQFIFLIPLCLAFIFFVNVFLLYNADALEDERHFYLTQTLIQLLSFFEIALLIDNIDFSKIIKKSL
jgi:hypothetical protein